MGRRPLPLVVGARDGKIIYTLILVVVVVLVVKGKLTVWSAWVVWSECGEVVHFAIHHYPAVVWFGVLVELGDGDLCV